MITRRLLTLGAAAAATLGGCATAPPRTPVDRRRHLILAPSNLGLAPNEGGAAPGTWRAPAALMAAGLQTRLGAQEVVSLNRPRYDFNAQAGTRIRNGHTIRRFSLEIGDAVRTAIQDGGFPVVIGGDCSVLLGCLYGARLAGARGLLHVDGYSEFFHPGNYNASGVLGAVAGMDLALATGRGEHLLTQWSDVAGPLVRVEDAIQIGERGAFDPNFPQYYVDIVYSGITRVIIEDVKRDGVAATARGAVSWLQARELARAWLHVDLGVLDQTVMPAIPTPGPLGLTFSELASLLTPLMQSGRVIGADVTIYDPERDPDLRYAAAIVEMLGAAFAYEGASAS